MSQSGQQALCGERSSHPDYPICGRPAVAPHPVDGYARPVCQMHRCVGLCDVTDCDNPSVWADVGDAGDIHLCREHMRP